MSMALMESSGPRAPPPIFLPRGGGLERARRAKGTRRARFFVAKTQTRRPAVGARGAARSARAGTPAGRTSSALDGDPFVLERVRREDDGRAETGLGVEGRLQHAREEARPAALEVPVRFGDEQEERRALLPSVLRFGGAGLEAEAALRAFFAARRGRAVCFLSPFCRAAS